jgi:hypothetical protein
MRDKAGPRSTARTAVPVSFGFRIKSGHAIAVVLSGSTTDPAAVARHAITLCDPDVAETRQPYHDGFYKQEDDTREIARRVKIVERCAARAVAAFVEGARREIPRISGCRAGLVVGSVIDPARVANPHIRAHASEGRLFRTVVEDALRAHGIESEILVEKTLAGAAVARLGCTDREIKRTLAAFGQALGGPWRADEKAAATAAWLALPDQKLTR